MKILGFIVILFCITETLAECPKMDDFPVMFDKTRFLCAVKYTGHGSDYTVDACNACGNDDPNGYRSADDNEIDAGEGYHYNAGSVIVRPGCHLYMYHVSHLIQGCFRLFVKKPYCSRMPILVDQLMFLVQESILI